MTIADEVKNLLDAALTADFAADVWDEEPSLVMIVRGGDGSINFKVASRPGSWDRETYAVIHGMAAAADFLYEMKITDARPFDPDETFLGVGLFNEGWGVAGANREEYEAIREWMAAGNRLEHHEKGIEMKMVSAVLTDGSTVHLTRHRGSGEAFDSSGNAEGRVVDALTHMLGSMQKWAALA